MTMWRQKSNDEGKKEQNNRMGIKKNNLIANRGLKSRVHRRTLLEEYGQDRVPELQFAADL
jgi:hypothetical protein